MILGYCRVSSDEQANHGISIEAQKDILSGFAAMKAEQIRIFVDAGWSGKNTDRPGLQDLLAAVRSGSAGSVVIWKLDRLSRSLRDTLSIIEDVLAPAGVTLVSVTESIDTSTPSGRMMLNLLASFAQLEREQDSDRVIMAHKHLAQDCRYLGGHVPLGYEIDQDKHYKLHPGRCNIVRHVFDMYMSRSGYSQILDYLNSDEIFPLTGRRRPFTKQDLYFMLRNEIYTGTFIRRFGHAPIRIPGGVPAILSRDDWNRICEIREQNASSAASYRSGRIYPLAGKVRCSVCGKPMPVRHGGKTRSGQVERYYRCSAGCVRPARVEAVENAAFTAIQFLANDSSLVEAACSIANTFAKVPEAGSEIAALDGRLKDIGVQASRLVRFIREHDAAPEAVLADLSRLEDEEKKIRARLEVLRRPRALYDADKMKQLLAAAGDIKNQPPGEQKIRCQAAIHGVLVSDTTYRILFSCPSSGGDEPYHYVEHTISR